MKTLVTNTPIWLTTMPFDDSHLPPSLSFLPPPSRSSIYVFNPVFPPRNFFDYDIIYNIRKPNPLT